MCQTCNKQDKDRKAERDRLYDALVEYLNRPDTRIYIGIFGACIKIDPSFKRDLDYGIKQSFYDGKDCPNYDYSLSKVGGDLYINTGL